ncbi:MAG: hypothetical protein HY396_00515 [Candidatus Doudnabacteria bacterium]|nr:hypothetical protein [Candidatus Doudnabacteria bacterium]
MFLTRGWRKYDGEEKKGQEEKEEKISVRRTFDVLITTSRLNNEKPLSRGVFLLK